MEGKLAGRSGSLGGNTGRKELGVWREALAGRSQEFGGKHWQEGAGSLKGKTGRKEPGVTRETLAGRIWEFGRKHWQGGANIIQYNTPVHSMG